MYTYICDYTAVDLTKKALDIKVDRTNGPNTSTGKQSNPVSRQSDGIDSLEANNEIKYHKWHSRTAKTSHQGTKVRRTCLFKARTVEYLQNDTKYDPLKIFIGW